MIHIWLAKKRNTTFRTGVVTISCLFYFRIAIHWVLSWSPDQIIKLKALFCSYHGHDWNYSKAVELFDHIVTTIPLTWVCLHSKGVDAFARARSSHFEVPLFSLSWSFLYGEQLLCRPTTRTVRKYVLFVGEKDWIISQTANWNWSASLCIRTLTWMTEIFHVGFVQLAIPYCPVLDGAIFSESFGHVQRSSVAWIGKRWYHSRIHCWDRKALVNNVVNFSRDRNVELQVTTSIPRPPAASCSRVLKLQMFGKPMNVLSERIARLFLRSSPSWRQSIWSTWRWIWIYLIDSFSNWQPV